MSDKITLLKQRYTLEQRIRTLQNPKLTEGKDVSGLLARMTSMLEHVNQQIAETASQIDQINSTWPINDKPKPQEIPVSEYDSHPDHEVQMARSDLYRAAKCAISLERMLKRVSEEQGLEGWVQAKITKAADYLESVYHYIDYEMKGEVDEATYGPGQKPSDQGDPNAVQQAPGAPQQNPIQPAPGQSSVTPPVGGSTPTATTPGMVKMAKIGPDKKPQGTPVMVRATDIISKQKQGFSVIGEAKEEKKVAHCSQCGKGFSNANVDAKYKTGFSHCKDHKGMRIIAEMSSGASGAGGIATSMGNGTGFASGGIGMQKRKKKIGEGMMVSRADADAALKNPEAKAIWSRYGQYNAQDLTQEFSNLSPGDAATIANWAEGGWAPGHTQAEMRGKLVHSILQLKQGLGEAGFNPSVSTPTTRAQAASRFGHDPDRAATVYKANKYNPETGLGGYVAPRGDTTDKSNILLQLKSNLDTATGKPLTFQDGSTLAIKPSIARTALAKIDAMRPVEKHETIKNLMTSKDAFVSFVKAQGESKETGPKFTGYWKGKDKGKPGKKMVGDA